MSFVDMSGTPTVVPVSPFHPSQDAELLRKAMKGMGTNEKEIIEILSQRTNIQRLKISEEYQQMFERDLTHDLKGELSGEFENVIIAMMTPLAQYYASELHRAVSGCAGIHEYILIEVLCTMSNEQIREIRQAYHESYGSSLESDLEAKTDGTFRSLMISLCRANRDESMRTDVREAEFDAERLAGEGAFRVGSEELIFHLILCNRNFAQLRMIFSQYHKLTGQDIEKTIKEKFSGDSELCMSALVRAIKNKYDFFAQCLHDYVKGIGTFDRSLIRVIVTRAEIDMEEIKREFHTIYEETLEHRIKHECSGDYKRCLLALIGQS